mgnify:CR=1 FL=1
MAADRCALTMYFEDPFWVGLFERWEGERYSVSKLTFGPEPRDAQVWERVLREFQRLPFSPGVPSERREEPGNPKRARRGARRQMEAVPRTGTKAQQALALQREEGKLARRERTRAEREVAEAERFRQRQEKRREKRRGH